MRQIRIVCLFSILLSMLVLSASILGHAQGVVRTHRGAVNFGDVNVCPSGPSGQTSPAPCRRTRELKYNVTATRTFGKTRVVTQGTPNLDFTRSATTCKGTLAAGSSCTVSATFAPMAPGVRMGAIELTDSSGNLLVTTLIFGEGQGPVAAFSPSLQITVPIGTLDDSAVAVDAAADVFVPADGGIVKIAPGGVQTIVAGGLNSVSGLAVDGAGNIYASLRGNNVVAEIASGSGAQTSVGEGLYQPWGVAVDKLGNVFIVDYGNKRVVKVRADTGTQTTVMRGFVFGFQILYFPTSVAVDGADDVFVSDEETDTVWEIPAGGSPIGVAPGLGPVGVAVDAAGDLFVADFFSNEVDDFPAGGGEKTIVGGEIPLPWALAVDGAGKVFVANAIDPALTEVNRSQPSTFDFGKVAVGSASNPQSITIQNVGNQPLNAIPPGLSISPGFLQVHGSTHIPDCSSDFSLAPGALCNLSIVFAPQAVGSITGTAVFTDNAMNSIPYASQIVKLKGRGIL